MSCHEPAAGPVDVATRHAIVALVGAPNVGKSTLFNAATGARQHVVNAPGTTVELATGAWRAAEVELVDLPGAYSLLARTPDEQVTADAVAGRGAAGDVDLVVAMVDATAVARSLYLVGQVARAGKPVVVALTMRDVAAGRGITVDAVALSAALGVPVVGVDPRSGRGIADLADAVRAAVAAGEDAARVRGPRRATGAPGDTAPGDGARGADDGRSTAGRRLADEPASADEGRPGAISRVAGDERTTAGRDLPLPGVVDPRLAEAEALFAWVQGVLAAVDPGAGARRATTRVRRTWSDRVDSVLLRPWVGIPVLLAVMWALFQLVTVAAAPLMNAVSAAVDGWFGGLLRGWLSGAPAWVGGFVVDGMLAGVATVLSFAPLIAIMFVAVALLEDSGYLARAAFVADRAMRRLGLDGRAVLPLVVGFGCNVPALAATRTLPHSRQRLLTGLLIPLTSCTARLTVYLMLAAVFFPDDAGTAVFAMYVLSALLVVGVGLLLRRTAFRDLRREPFVVALPAYQRPRLRAIGTSAWVRVWSFVHKAGSIIVATLAVVWVLMAIPVTSGHAVAEVPVQDSVYGRVAGGIAPVFAPAGYADWHATSALMTGFVAKEVVVGSMAQSFAVTEPADPSRPGDLGAQLRATFDRTSGGAAGAAAFAFMVFVLAYTPCLATMAEQARLFGRRWTVGAVGAQLVLAWVLSVVAFQVGRLL
ncbi:ferrous iron transport protein B [Cellulomonas sp. 73-92]|uniref:ferrous iron transport protein B n=1 Tax=Cellulomonas sp. 73-92 TaxID=1895740 RepID=UPI000A5F90EA|nr:ferrous iron transport protein B [Cellulomonas sp. 73-92]